MPKIMDTRFFAILIRITIICTILCITVYTYLLRSLYRFHMYVIRISWSFCSRPIVMGVDVLRQEVRAKLVLR